MKKRTISIIAGLSIAANVITGTAIAAEHSEIIQAILNRDIKMMWNGEEMNLIDPANGERIYPITYNDRTYLPVRFIAEKAGVNVGWDGTSQEVQMGTGGYDYTKPSIPAPSTPTPQKPDNLVISENFDFTWLTSAAINAGSGLKIADTCYTYGYVSAGNVWNGTRYESSAGVAYVFPALKLVPVNDQDKISTRLAKAAMETSLATNGYTLVKTDSMFSYYQKGDTEICITDDEYNVTFQCRTGWQRIVK